MSAVLYTRRPNLPEPLGGDPWLAPYLAELAARQRRVEAMESRLTSGPARTLADFASAHEFFGLHRTADGWVFREWAPAATGIVLIGDFSDWKPERRFRLRKIGNGAWELRLAPEVLRPGMHYLIQVSWPGGGGNRVPVYARIVDQDERTKLFSAVVPPEGGYRFIHPSPARPEAPLIYEAHIGMAQEEPKVGTFNEFRARILPRIAASGYNTLQLMAIMGHPYYGSFGYHVANFFAVSSRFGTPDEFKELVDEAHRLGLRVIIDLIHSHAVKNEVEGPARIDGTRYAYFHDGERGLHSGWDSLCFDYGKIEVLHFLLSNCRYWLDEFHLDGFRFDGVTSMLYLHHGLNRVFSGYDDYFSEAVDNDAVTYLSLANRLIHTLRPDAVTIAEDVSGMPGLAAADGIGFDYRLAMGVSDMWFKLFDLPDESWNMFYLYGELINRRRDERSISYVECHDQAIVGGKTAMFTLADAAMYDAMDIYSDNPAIDRAMALHKMIRLATAATAGNGYLNFMGNEFGHPEWIDFPREGNHWSLWHARRQWSLAEAPGLRYRFLNQFDRAMIELAGRPGFYLAVPQTVRVDNEKKVLIFERAGYWFCFNFHPTVSCVDYEFEVPEGSFETVLDSDSPDFGGFSLRRPDQHYFSRRLKSGSVISCYLPCRTALVLRKTD